MQLFIRPLLTKTLKISNLKTIENTDVLDRRPTFDPLKVKFLDWNLLITVEVRYPGCVFRPSGAPKIEICFDIQLTICEFTLDLCWHRPSVSDYLLLGTVQRARTHPPILHNDDACVHHAINQNPGHHLRLSLYFRCHTFYPNGEEHL